MELPKDPSERFRIVLDGRKAFDVVGLGMNAVDHLCVVPSYPRFNTKTEVVQYDLQPGGPVASALVVVARMGLKAKYIGKVGADEPGMLQRRSLEADNVDISSLVIEPGARSQYAFIIIDRRTGERTILWGRDRRLDFRPGELAREDVCAGRLLHLDGEDQEAGLVAAAWAREAGIPVVMDLDRVKERTRDLIRMADFLITSASFPEELTGVADPAGALRAMRDLCPGFLAVTLGAGGAAALFGDECVHFPAFPVEAADTTGAGDVFHGAFLYGLLQNWPAGRIMKFANATAALGCTRIGVRAGIPALGDALRLAGLDMP